MSMRMLIDARHPEETRVSSWWRETINKSKDIKISPGAPKPE